MMPRWTKALLVCGILAPLVLVGTDIVAGLRYPGYSFTSQAVSELFAIGAPTSRFVVPLFSLASLLVLAFAVGVWRSAGEKRLVRIMAVTFAVSAVNGLALWVFFPMHMRGAERTFTDTMHLILAANPLVLVSLGLGVAAFKQWFRFYSIGTIVILVSLASLSFTYAPLLDANQPTPWLGLSERIAQWAFHLWQSVLAIVLIARAGAGAGPAMPRLAPTQPKQRVDDQPILHGAAEGG